MPRRAPPTTDEPPHPLDIRALAESLFHAAFLKAAKLVGEKEAREIGKRVLKRPRGRPRGPKHPSVREELQRIANALAHERTPIAEAAKLIHGAYPKRFGDTEVAVRAAIRRLPRNI